MRKAIEEEEDPKEVRTKEKKIIMENNSLINPSLILKERGRIKSPGKGGQRVLKTRKRILLMMKLHMNQIFRQFSKDYFSIKPINRLIEN